MAGAKEDDYVVDNELNKVIVEESAREADETKEATEQQAEDPEKFTSLADATAEKSGLGSISFVSCATGADAIEPPSLVSEAEEGKLLSCSSVYHLFLSSVSSYYFSFVLFRGQAKAYKRNCCRAGYVFVFVFVLFCWFCFSLTLADGWIGLIVVQAVPLYTVVSTSTSSNLILLSTPCLSFLTLLTISPGISASATVSFVLFYLLFFIFCLGAACRDGELLGV